MVGVVAREVVAHGVVVELPVWSWGSSDESVEDSDITYSDTSSSSPLSSSSDAAKGGGCSSNSCARGVKQLKRKMIGRVEVIQGGG